MVDEVEDVVVAVEVDQVHLDFRVVVVVVVEVIEVVDDDDDGT